MTKTMLPAFLGGAPTLTADGHTRWPILSDEDRDAVVAVLDSGTLTGLGAPNVAALEREFGAFVGTRHCLAMNSGTAALHACAVALDLTAGDEFIVPAFTYGASAMGPALHGATPVFADVDPATYNLDPARIAERVTPRTKALVVVHLHGMPAAMDAIQAVADRHGLAIIEDFAQAQGATFRGRSVGTFGACSATSLNATKNLPAGEGGLFVTDDDDAEVAARRLRYLGEDMLGGEPSEGREYWSCGLGWNYRLPEMTAAIACSQLTRLPAFNARARENAAILTAGLAELPGITPPVEPDGCASVYYAYRVHVDPDHFGWTGPRFELRDRVVRALQAEGLRAGLWQHRPLPAQPAFRRPLRPWHRSNDGDLLAPWSPSDYPNSTRVGDETLILGAGTAPWAAQSPDIARRYVEAFAKVVGSADALGGATLAPVPRRDLGAGRP
jgi:perosamine synthetase